MSQNIHNSFLSLKSSQLIIVFVLSVCIQYLCFLYFRRGRVIPLSLITSHHLINYTDQLANVIVSNANYSFRMGEGRLIEYNFVCIERDLCTSFMVNKPYIENDLDIELTELRLFNHLKTIQVNVPQVSRKYVCSFPDCYFLK